MSGRRVLVLGATGFLGRHICDAFTAAGHEVFRVSRGGSADPAETGLALDLAATGPAELVALLARARPQVLVNAAATVWQQDPAAMRALNGEFVERLVGVLSASSARPRLVHLGSVHEYGPVPDGAELTERVQAAPTGVYGNTKLRGSRAVLRASRTPGVAKGTPLGSVIRPPCWAALARRPESSISALVFTPPAQPPRPCFGSASETKGERGSRYSLRKIWVTRSLK